MIAGVEGRHAWTPPGASEAAATLGYLTDDAGAKVWPRVKLRAVNYGSLGDSEDRRDLRVGAIGEIPRRSFRRGKTDVLEGDVQARTLSEFRTYEDTLRAAFADQSDEGRMDVSWHPLLPILGGQSRYIEARALGLEIGDPIRKRQHYEGTFVLSLRRSDPRHFEEITDAEIRAAFKQSVLDLEPELYWALDDEDGATDLSGNGRDGTENGGIVVGGGPALTVVPGDSSTDITGTQYVESPNNPLAAVPWTVIAFLQRDTETSYDTFFSAFGLGANGGSLSFSSTPPFASGQLEINLGGFSEEHLTGIGTGTPVLLGLTGLDGDEAEVFVDGSSQGVLTGAVTMEPASHIGVGGTAGDPSWFDGKIAHVAVFERALTAEEIASVYERANWTKAEWQEHLGLAYW